MKNLFTISTQSFFDEISSISPNELEEKIPELYDRWMREICIFLSREEQEKLDKKTTITEVADYCIGIMIPMLRFPFLKPVTNSISLFNQLMASLPAKAVLGQPEVLNDDEKKFLSDLKYFLLLSFIYRQSCTSIFPSVHQKNVSRIFQNNLDETIIANRFSKFNNIKSQKTRKKSKKYAETSIENKSTNEAKVEEGRRKRKSPQNIFKKYMRNEQGRLEYTPQHYLEFFIPYQKNIRGERLIYTLSSWYDVNIFIGLTTSRLAKNNPYMTTNLNPEECICDIGSFLSFFNPLASYSSNREKRKTVGKIPPFAQRFPNEKDPLLVWTNNVVEKMEETYRRHLKSDQDWEVIKSNFSFFPYILPYLIERVTCVNLINAILKRVTVQHEFRTLDSFYGLSSYPLLNYRRRFMDMMARFSNNERWIDLTKLNENLKRIISHHLFVAFPRLEIFFHLTLLRNGLYFKKITSNIMDKMEKHNEFLKHIWDEEKNIYDMKPYTSFDGGNTYWKKKSSIIFETILWLGTYSYLGESHPFSFTKLRQKYTRSLMRMSNFFLTAVIENEKRMETTKNGECYNAPWIITLPMYNYDINEELEILWKEARNQDD